MPKLIFSIEALKPIVAHARESKQHTPTFSMMQEPKYWKPGAQHKAGGFASGEDIDLSKVPAHLQLVKDHGVYILSSGCPRQLDPQDAAEQRSLVAYAAGYGPEDDWEAWNSVSGDDFVESIDLSFVIKAIDQGASSLEVSVTPAHISLAFNKAAPIGPKRVRPFVLKSTIRAAQISANAGTQPGGLVWASEGGTYKGVIVAEDSWTMFQKKGRRIILHEKVLLPTPLPALGESIVITYPEDQNLAATFAPAKANRKKT